MRLGARATVEKLQRLIAEGKMFSYDNFSTKGDYGYPTAFTSEFIAWRTRVINLLRKAFGAESAPVRVLEDGLAVRLLGNGEDKFNEMIGKLVGALVAGADILEDDRFGEALQELSDETVPTAIPSNRVFIVHGHDDQAKNELEMFVREIGLDPIVLHRQPDEGQTVIEKFEKHSDVGYAFVILTPDDIAYSATEDELADGVRQKEWRARQNVIFELGFFIGRLGRSRVCCLFRKPVALPSDINGVLYKPFDRSVQEAAYSIMKELRAVGYTVTL
jgi:predicted nucleotide-binding protein